MSILKYKYKAHKFINYAFYLVVFIVGFLLGFSTEKINFNKLISQVLMIDNVSALDIGTINGNKINEEFIFNTFNNFEEDFIQEYPYIVCIYHTTPILECNAYSEEYFSTLYVKSTDNYKYGIGTTGGNNYKLMFSMNKNGVITGPTTHLNNGPGGSSTVDTLFWRNGTGYSMYSNFDLKTITGSNSTYKRAYTLDFSSFMEVDYWLNDGSIFKDEDHQDFKEVCWENFDELMFSVTISKDKEYDITHHEGQQEGETYIDSGFYVFDDVKNLKRGTRMKLTGAFDYDMFASTWVSGATFNHLKNITSEFYLMKNEDLLDARYSDTTNALGNYDIVRGDSYYYDNLSKLLNATYVGFTYYYNVLDDFKYDIFYLQEEKEKFCIYIPNDFIVTTLTINELGGFVGDIPIHTDSEDVFIDKPKELDKLSYKNLFSIINQFISSIRDTVNLINSYIYSLFTSLPPLVQMFIFTIITLIVIKTIIWMVVK